MDVMQDRRRRRQSRRRLLADHAARPVSRGLVKLKAVVPAMPAVFSFAARSDR
jgi:hypothetical protein